MSRTASKARGEGEGMGMCRELVMHSSGRRCGCRERRLFTHHPHCPSYTPGNTVVREQATSGGWPSDPRSQRHVPGSPQPGSGSCSGCPVHATRTWCCSSPRSTQLDHPDSWLSLPHFSAAMKSSFSVPTFEVRETEEGRGFAMVTPWLVVSQFCRASPSILRDQPPHG